MGQPLSFPETQKRSKVGRNRRFLAAVTKMQGWRTTMEDTHAGGLSLNDGTDPNGFFAVYDGHSGGSVSKFAATHVHKRLVTEEAYRDKRYEEALKRVFLGTDEDMLANPAFFKYSGGCTTIAALITADYC